MGAFAKLRQRRRGFTLVELLVVIVIIGMLAGMISAAAIMARGAAKRAVIKTEISQLDMALQKYKTEYGEYPPDFVGLNTDDDPSVNTLVELAAMQSVNRHLRKRFPRYSGNWNMAAAVIQSNYGIDATRLDAASALAFWLGGLPETAGSETPAGFHTDPSNPFKLGLPRTEPLFDFDPERYVYTEQPPPALPALPVLQCRYSPAGVRGVDPTPYVYFKSQRAPTGERTYFYMQLIPPVSPPVPARYAIGFRTWQGTTSQGLAVAYRNDGALTDWDNEACWANAATYQILCAGLDGLYGTRVAPPAALRVVDATDLQPPAVTDSSDHTDFSSFKTPGTRTGDGFDKGDHDNLTSFADGELEDQVE